MDGDLQSNLWQKKGISVLLPQTDFVPMFGKSATHVFEDKTSSDNNTIGLNLVSV